MTIDDVQYEWDVAHTGTASLTSETTAVSGSGALDTDDIAEQLRFSCNRVSGQITKPQSEESDGSTKNSGEVESIPLPTATNLNSNAQR